MTIHAEPHERLDEVHAAVYMNIPLKAFRDQVKLGVWNGCFVMQGGDLRFIAGKLVERQEQMAERTTIGLANEARSRKRAA